MSSSPSFKFALTGLLLLGGNLAAAATQGTLPVLSIRAEDEGSACSEEGKWNCMDSSWQRCGGGVWSLEMPLAKGTKCTPNGLTDDVDIDYDDDDHDDDDDDDDDDASHDRNAAQGGFRPFGDVRGWGLVGTTMCLGAASVMVSSTWTGLW